MFIRLDYSNLEEKFDIKINYPRDNKPTYKNKIMCNMLNFHERFRGKTSKIIPLTDEEELYKTFRKDHNRDINEKKETFIQNVAPYYEIEFIHMYDFIPKEYMSTFMWQMEKFKKKHVSAGYPIDAEEVRQLADFIPNSFIQSRYSFAIKENSPLYKYITELYISFQDLSTSINTVIYSVVLNEKYAQKMNEIYLCQFPDYYYLDNSNLKWYEFIKMGRSQYTGVYYKRSFINDCIMNIRWNILKIFCKSITIYLADLKNGEVLPCVVSYKTNISGSANAEFWASVNVEAPQFCDFFKSHNACMNLTNATNKIEYIRKEEKGKEGNVWSMDVRYQYSQYLIRDTLIENTYAKIKKYMDNVSRLNNKHHTLKKWLLLKRNLEREILYYKRFYNEQRSDMYQISDYENYFLNTTQRDISITQQLIKGQEECVKEAKIALEQLVEYVDTNINYRNTEENILTQKRTLIYTFLSMTVALIALVITIITNANAMEFINSYWEIIKKFFG